MNDFAFSSLSELVDFSDIQRMLEAHYTATDMPSGIIDTSNGAVLAGVGWQEICTRFHRAHPVSARRCQESDLDISSHIEGGKPYATKCRNGMWDIGIPIVVANKQMATFFLGQFRYEFEGTDVEFFERQAEELGFDKNAYLKALARVPVFSRERVASILEYNQAFASFIGKLAESNLNQRQQLSITRKAQQELAEQQAFMHAVLETIPIPIFIKNKNLVYTGCNEAFEHMLGLGRKDILGNDSYSIAPKHLADIYTEMDRQLFQRGGKQVYKGKINPPGGGTYDVEFHKALLIDASGEATGFVGVVFNITDLLNAEKELEKSRNYIQSILDSSPSAVIGVNEKGVINHWNVRAEQFFGLSRNDTVGRPLEDALRLLEPYRELLAKALREGSLEMIERLRLEREQGVCLVDVQFYPLVAQDIRGAVIRVDDVTERERLREIMIQTEKMMTVGGLAAGMAHEINNPLGAILQSAQVIENRIAPDREVNRREAQKVGCDIDAANRYLEARHVLDFLRNIREAGNRAGEIISNMIDFSRKSDAGKSFSDLAKVLDKSVALVSSDYDLKRKTDFKLIEIRREYAPDVPEVYCSRTEIQQVLINLLKNAAQAMCGMMEKGKKPVITLRLKRAPGKAIIEVEDNGPGVDPAIRNRVFEPFLTTKKPGEGTGLGLSVSFFIVVNNHEGYFRVEEAPDRGAKFIIELPLGRQPHQEIS